VLPIIGKGSVQNITDILYLKGIDIGIVQSDVLEFIKREQIHPAIGQHFRRIATRYDRRAVYFLAFIHIACCMLWMR